MPREEPYFRKCCYCIPLKSCLEAWSLVKWVVDISLAGVFALAVVFIQCFKPELQWGMFTMSHMFLITSVVLIIDSVFMLILFVALCTGSVLQRKKRNPYSLLKSTDPDDVPAFVAKELHKLPPVTFDHVDVTRLLKDITSLKAGLAENNLGLLRAIYFYSIFMVFLEAACLIGFLILNIPSKSKLDVVVVFVLFGLINAALDTCIIFTLKSEIIKLRNKQQYQFQKMPTLVKQEEHGKLKEPFQADAENDVLSQISEL